MLTPAIATTEIAAIVLTAALAVLTLEYRGGEAVRWLRRVLGRSSSRTSEPTQNTDLHPTETLEPASSVAPRSTVAIEMLRIATGVIWLVNLLFIVLPSADYWSTFTSVAQSYSPITLGGPGFAIFVAANSLVFAWLIAFVTVYLAVALILGVTTRLACVVGTAFSLVFFITQWGATFMFPGGTDVGAHPLYIVIYAALWIGGAGQSWSVDGRLWKRGWRRRVPSARWFITSPGPRGTQKPAVLTSPPVRAPLGALTNHRTRVEGEAEGRGFPDGEGDVFRGRSGST